MFIHVSMRGSLVFKQLHGCSESRSNQDLLTASRSSAAFWRRCTHFLPPCAPAMQQYELRAEEREAWWCVGRRILGEWGEGRGGEGEWRGEKKRQDEIIVRNICINNGHIAEELFTCYSIFLILSTESRLDILQKSEETFSDWTPISLIHYSNWKPPPNKHLIICRINHENKDLKLTQV